MHCGDAHSIESPDEDLRILTVQSACELGLAFCQSCNDQGSVCEAFRAWNTHFGTQQRAFEGLDFQAVGRI